MSTTAELKALAWRRLWAEKWFGRLFGGGLLLGLCGYAVQLALGVALEHLNVQTWEDYVRAVIANRQTLTTPIPNLTPDYVFQATSSTVLILFFSYLMAGIAAYGTAVILLKCLKNDDRNWLEEAFGGFKCPFGMLWLFTRYILIFVGWGLFLVVPPLGIWLMTVAFYRYRFLFLVKAEHPDWSAGECLRFCRKLMDGHKKDSFRLDCAYWKPITVVLLLALTVMCGACLTLLLKDNGAIVSLVSAGGLVAVVACCVASVVCGQYISVGQGFLYRDLKEVGSGE